MIEEGMVEFVGSGYAQIIGPLVPEIVTEHNLEIGRDRYEKLLNVHPRVAYLNEQTYSAGMIDLYRNAGFEALITEWDNAAIFHSSWEREMKYGLVQARGASGAITGLKSGTSRPTHFFWPSSHQMSFFLSLHGLPLGSAEARL